MREAGAVLFKKSGFDLGAVEVELVGEIGPGDVAFAEIGAGKIGLIQMRVFQMGPGEIGALEIGAGKTDAFQIGVTQIRA